MASISSSLPGPALQASKAALNAALAENPLHVKADVDLDPAEPGEIQEIDMVAQAENIKTVFNDPQNFNVKVCVFPMFLLCFFLPHLFSSFLSLCMCV
jgi:translation initiation factor 4E